MVGGAQPAGLDPPQPVGGGAEWSSRGQGQGRSPESRARVSRSSRPDRGRRPARPEARPGRADRRGGVVTARLEFLVAVDGEAMAFYEPLTAVLWAEAAKRNDTDRAVAIMVEVKPPEPLGVNRAVLFSPWAAMREQRQRAADAAGDPTGGWGRTTSRRAATDETRVPGRGPRASGSGTALEQGHKGPKSGPFLVLAIDGPKARWPAIVTTPSLFLHGGGPGRRLTCPLARCPLPLPPVVHNRRQGGPPTRQGARLKLRPPGRGPSARPMRCAA